MSEIKNTKSGVLQNVRILDFTRLLPGPLAAMFLADLGAEVIKIENPDSPDYIRFFEPSIGGVSMLYLALNRNKKSLAVNYLSAEGKKIIHELVKNADVLLEQFRPDVMKQIGLGYDELSALNPKLIYVSITGYGQNSSRAKDAGHDLNYIALAGALGITGNENALTIPGFQLADIAGSYMAMNAVTAALYQREKTGKGDWIDVAMTDAAVPFSVLQFANTQAQKKDIPRGKYELSGLLANYNVYKCKDEKFVALGSLEPKFWIKFCAKVNRNNWTEKFFQPDEFEKMKNEVQELFLEKTRDEWLAFFKNEDVCLTAVNSLSELENDVYLNERKMFLENEYPAVGKYKTINQPLKFKHANFNNNNNAPDLGAHSEEILRELNFTDSEIGELKKKGIVK